MKAVTLVLLAVLAAPAVADDWVRLQGAGFAVEAPPRHARLARTLVAELPRRAGEVRQLLGLEPPAGVTLVVGHDAGELSARLGARLPEWVAGVALKAERKIGLNASAVGVTPAAVILRHELTHLAVGSRVGAGRRIPLWLEEGICQWIGGKSYLGTRADLLPQLSFDGLLAWRDLESRFPARQDKAALAYMQSYSFVEYMARAHGRGFVLEIVDRVAAGAAVHEAVLAMTGKAQVDLEQAWMEFEKNRAWRTMQLVQAFSPLALAALLAVVAFARRSARARNLHREWDEEEEGVDEDGSERPHFDPGGPTERGAS